MEMEKDVWMRRRREQMRGKKIQIREGQAARKKKTYRGQQCHILDARHHETTVEGFTAPMASVLSGRE